MPSGRIVLPDGIIGVIELFCIAEFFRLHENPKQAIFLYSFNFSKRKTDIHELDHKDRQIMEATV